MPKKTHDEIKAGIFIILTIAILVAIILWLGVADVLRRSGQVVAFYIPADSLGAGVQEGSAVTIGGKRIGQVTKVVYEADQGRTLYIARLQQRDIHVYADGVATAVSGLVGGAEVAIVDAGSSDQPLAGIDNPIQISGGIQKAISDLAATLEMIRVTTETELDSTQPDSLLAQTHLIMNNLEMATGSVAEITAALSMETDPTRAASLMAKLHAILDSGEDLMPALTDAADRLADVLSTMRVMAEKINAGEGSLGEMLNDPKMYQGMVDSIKQLEMLLKDIRAVVAVWKEQGIPMQLK